MCLFVNLGLPLLCPLLDWQLFNPAGPWGRTRSSIWCQFVWCQQAKTLCFSISILTSGARASLVVDYFTISNETYCMVGVIHDKLSKSTHSHISFHLSKLRWKFSIFLVLKNWHWLLGLMNRSYWKCRCTCQWHCPGSKCSCQVEHNSVTYLSL